MIETSSDLVAYEVDDSNRLTISNGDSLQGARLAESPAGRSVDGRSVDGRSGDGGFLLRIANHEPGSLEACIDRYGALVWSLARRFSPTLTDAEDAVQEIFLDLWQKADRYDPTASAESTFITMISRRKLIDRHRRTTRSIETVGMGIDSFGSDEPSWHDSSVELEVADEAAKANRCLESMQPKPKEVLRQSIHFGKSHSQIATELDLPLGSVKSFARRGLIQLRECMDRWSSDRPEVAAS